jgi:SAM-dependent methyltransferase
VNLDLYGRRDLAHGTRGIVTYGDAQDLGEFKTGTFGAVLASHILEHLPRPEAALKEWLRVAGYDPNALFVVTPSWWAPHTFLHPGHLNYFSDGAGGTRGGRRIPLRAKLGPTANLLSLRGYSR